MTSSVHSEDSQFDAELDRIVEQYLAGCRRGDEVTVAEFAAEYPRHEQRLLDLLPMIRRLEQLVPETDHRAADGGDGKASIGQAASTRVPTRLGEYRLLSVIGEGGMGVVYEAYHERLCRTVALKTLRPEFRTDRRLAQRFHQEAVAAGSLHHPHIVPIYEIGSDGGIEFLAMQHVSGQTLSAIIREIASVRGRVSGAGERVSESLANWRSDPAEELTGERPEVQSAGSTVRQQSASTWTPDQLRHELTGLKYFRRVARMMADVADAVQAAHDRTVIHRDIKPSNLMIDGQCKIWVTDFGLAKVQGSDLSRTHDVIGTIRYMSPEQLRGQADPRSDVYALGATAYEFLTLRPAFSGSDFGELVQAIVDGRAERLRSVDARIPRDLETIVHKAMATDRAERYATAAEFRDDLLRFADLRPIQARRSSPFHQLVSWARRQPLAATAVGLVCLLVTGWLITVQVYNVHLSRTAAILAIRQAIEMLSSGQTGGIADLMGQFETHSFGNLGRFIARNWDQSAQKIEHHENRHAVLEVGWTPAGHLLSMDFLGDLICTDLESGTVLWTVPGIRPREGGDFSINQQANEMVICARGDVLVRIDLATGARKPVSEPDAQGGVRPIYSTDGKYLAAASWENYRVWDMTTGEVIHRGILPEDAQADRPRRFSANNSILEYTSKQGDWVRWDWQAGKLVEKFSPGADQYWVYRGDKVGWLSSGHSLSVAADAEHQATVVELSSGKTLWSMPVSRHGQSMMAVSPDETRFAIPTLGGVVEVYDVVEREKHALMGHTGKLRGVAWDHSGNWLASGGLDRTVRIWNWRSVRPVASWQATCRPAMDWEGVLDPEITPDQQYLLVHSEDTLRIFKLETLELVATLHPTSDDIASVNVSPDSRTAAVGTRAGEVILYEIATGRELARRQATPGEVEVYFSRDPSLVVTLSENGDCWRWNWTTNESKLLYNDGNMLMAACFDRENRNVIVGGIGGRLVLIDLQGQRKERVWDTPGISVQTLEYSPDFQWLACTGVTNQIRLYQVGDSDLEEGGKVAYRDLPTPAGGDSGLQWSPEGDFLWTGNGRQLQAWTPTEGQPIATFSGYLVPDVIHRPLPVGGHHTTEVITHSPEHRITHLRLTGDDWTPEFHRRKRLYNRLAWLFEQYELTEEILERLASDEFLDRTERAAATVLARDWHESPYTLRRNAEAIILKRDAPRERYQHALRVAERLVELWPNSGQALNLRAAALCRLENHSEALVALQSAVDRLANEPLPAARVVYSAGQRQELLRHRMSNQIFRAISLRALGRTDEARRVIQQAVSGWKRDFGDILPPTPDEVTALVEALDVTLPPSGP